ncbi:MAG: magnesium chelatase [Vicinamibacteria bacterium]
MTTLEGLKKQGLTCGESVKDEMRRNLLKKLRDREPLFPGIVGYDESVIPEVVNAILSKHHMILLGLRGQAKTRLIRQLVSLLDEKIPMVKGCEIRDDPFAPLCGSCRAKVAAQGDGIEIDWLYRDERYVEKLATPDVTIADMLGDLDPIKAAKGGHVLSSDSSIHYGLLPRSNRGIFAINELPDLAPRIQVGLFNVLQEGDIQIKGFPVRLRLDVAMVFTANPEDYTARGKIVTPLKDRIGSEIRTHYPETIELSALITASEAFSKRSLPVFIPEFVRHTVEAIAFAARRDRRVDKKSGVSQRLAISVLENALSSAERRAMAFGETEIVPRISDIYVALPAVTGKIELEYEGEMAGGAAVGRELVREGLKEVFAREFGGTNLRAQIEFFEQGGEIDVSDDKSAGELLATLSRVPGILAHAGRVLPERSDAPTRAAAAEFILEGLFAQKKIGRSDAGTYVAVERKSDDGADPDRLERLARLKRQVN